MENFVYFGYDRFDAYLNMALDEVMMSVAAKDCKSFVRFYDFNRPALILAYVEHYSDVIAETADGYDITRRLSNGSVILCDDNTLAYSVAVPKNIHRNPTEMHRVFGSRIGQSLKAYMNTDEVSIGEHFSVRVNNQTIAGHGQKFGTAILYHGVLAVYPWDMKRIMAIRLREGEYEFIQSLPSVAEYVEDVKKEELVQRLLSGITNGNYEAIDPEKKAQITSDASQRASFYRHEDWIKFGPYHDREHLRQLLLKKSGLGFCFADFLTPERVKDKV